MRILVVEDERARRDGLCDLLAGDGHDVIAVAGGTLGAARGVAEPFDVVVLDVMLQGSASGSVWLSPVPGPGVMGGDLGYQPRDVGGSVFTPRLPPAGRARSPTLPGREAVRYHRAMGARIDVAVLCLGLAVAMAASACGRLGYDAAVSDSEGDVDAAIDAAGGTGTRDAASDPIDGMAAIPCAEACPGQCAEELCVIDCSDGCNRGEVVCPAGLACQIDCTGSAACASGVDCSEATACEITCSGPAACAGGLVCPADGPCAAACTGPQSCAGATECGAGRCSVVCSGEESCAGALDCARACACDSVCTGSQSCAGAADCPAGCAESSGCDSSPAGCDSCPSRDPQTDGEPIPRGSDRDGIRSRGRHRTRNGRRLAAGRYRPERTRTSRQGA